jgi:hypothetical protein
MAVTQRVGIYGVYFGSTWGSSESLSSEYMNMNAQYIYSYLSAEGWTLNAIAAILGNMQAESAINPGRWQSNDVGNTSLGYGLVQWTPATKYIDWCSSEGRSDPSEMDNNLARIVWEVANKQQWRPRGAYSSMSFSEFTKSTESCLTLAKAFLLCYERPKDQSVSKQEYRASLAAHYYTLLSGVEPDPPSGSYRQKKKKFNFVLTAHNRRYLWTNRP